MSRDIPPQATFPSRNEPQPHLTLLQLDISHGLALLQNSLQLIASEPPRLPVRAVFFHQLYDVCLYVLLIIFSQPTNRLVTVPHAAASLSSVPPGVPTRPPKSRSKRSSLGGLATAAQISASEKGAEDLLLAIAQDREDAGSHDGSVDGAGSPTPALQSGIPGALFQTVMDTTVCDRALPLSFCF